MVGKTPRRAPAVALAFHKMGEPVLPWAPMVRPAARPKAPATAVPAARRPWPRATLLSVSDVARELGVSRNTVWKWIRSGVLEVTRLGPKIVRISPVQVDAMIARANPRPKAARV